MKNEDLIKIVIHGRGGQGAVTACEILAEAAFLSGKFLDVQAYPSFGAERRGAPVQAYAKLSRTEQIWDRAEIEEPNILIIFDESVLTKEITNSLEEQGIFIINSAEEPAIILKMYDLNKAGNIIAADISNLALEKNLTIDGNPVINTPILGLLSKALPELSLENLKKVVIDKMGEKIGILNAELIDQGYTLAKTLI
ncbi:MAG: pyruvate ferredoxin oxidoreductase [Candidatus Lokiarchaeota archaeon]|nr:pyruvate ferredoxin oxidoreductase [Candidatus Lokiarchaeota archaeon]